MEDFKTTYKQAYEQIAPNPNYLNGIRERLDEKHRNRQQMFIIMMRPVATACVVMLLMSLTVLPAMAKSMPQVYNIIEKYAPALADFVLPVELSDTSQGITMRVEAINVKDDTIETGTAGKGTLGKGTSGNDSAGNGIADNGIADNGITENGSIETGTTENDVTGNSTAEIIVSFADAEGSDKDLINGKVDMYDSYHLQSYGATYGIGGGGFLEYDATEDKAYLRIQLSTDGEYDKGKLRFKVRQLLTNCNEEKKWLDLENIIMNPETKTVSLSGSGGNREVFSQYFEKGNAEDSRPDAKVMDIKKADESMEEALTVTGIGYADGILRIQTCRGNFTDADRHMQPFLVDSQGNERRYDHSVGWQEDVNGERLLFEEHWFLVEENELENIQIYGIFYITDGSVKGNWELTCEL